MIAAVVGDVRQAVLSPDFPHHLHESDFGSTELVGTARLHRVTAAPFPLSDGDFFHPHHVLCGYFHRRLRTESETEPSRPDRDLTDEDSIAVANREAEPVDVPVIEELEGVAAVKEV